MNKKDIYTYEEYLSLISQVKKCITTEKDMNYFEIMGQPHYENVVSNILKFFFDPQGEHGFKDIWLRSLLSCVDEKFIISDSIVIEDIFREQTTDNGKRMDLIIITPNDVIVIENKIYSCVQNPLKDYKEWVNKYYGKKDNKIFIILSLREHSEKDEFINITYKELFKRIQKAESEESYKNCLDKIHNKWVIFKNEFINNIKALGERLIMNKEWQEVLKTFNEKTTLDIFDNFITNYRVDIERKSELLKTIKRNIQIECNVNYHNRGIYNASMSFDHSNTSKYVSAWFDFIDNDGHILVIEFYFKINNPLYLYLNIFKRGLIGATYENEKNDLNSAFEHLTLRNDWSDWGNYLELKQYDFSKYSSITDLQSIVENDIYLILKELSTIRTN